MTDLAGFGTQPWLPPRVRAAQLREAAAELRESRRAEGEAETEREARHERAMALYCAGAEQRGEVVNALDLAAGRVSGRAVGDILAGAAAMADRQDAAEAWRQARGEAEPVHVEFVGDPVIHHAAPRSARAMTMRRLYRRFTESREANRAAVEKRRMLDAELIPLQETVVLNRPETGRTRCTESTGAYWDFCPVHAVNHGAD